MACALSLQAHGFDDFVIVDALVAGQNTSRAMLVHACTLEVLDTIGCASVLSDAGIHSARMVMQSRRRPLIIADYTQLAGRTRYPFALVVPQDVTERVLGEKLKERGVHAVRPKTVVSARSALGGGTVILFDGGEEVTAQYIVGADGARSTVRQLAGITFSDPQGPKANDKPTALAQMVIADVLFDDETHLPADEVQGVLATGGFFVFLPLPVTHTLPAAHSPSGQDEPRRLFRIGSGVPPDDVPPSAPGTEYLQGFLDAYGPLWANSDPTVSKHPVRIAHTVWSSRFRTHSAIADRTFARLGENGEGARVALVGDAAHIHSPAGGQGMNLGIRDAITLGEALAAQISSSSRESDGPLKAWSAARHARAQSVIALTKTILGVFSPDVPLVPARLRRSFAWSPVGLPAVRDAVLATLNRSKFVRGKVALKLSALETP